MGYCEEEDGGVGFSLVVSYNNQHLNKKTFEIYQTVCNG